MVFQNNLLFKFQLHLCQHELLDWTLFQAKTNTVELYMDGGWQFTFRIHNAETYVIPSLKFDIQIVGMPTAIITINCLWK